MRAGRLRHRVSVERMTTSQNSYGEPISSWTTLANTYAAIEPLSGKERFDTDQELGDSDTRIILRYGSDLSDLSPKDRIKHGAVAYDIVETRNLDERDRELHLRCRRVY